MQITVSDRQKRGERGRKYEEEFLCCGTLRVVLIAFQLIKMKFFIELDSGNSGRDIGSGSGGKVVVGSRVGNNFQDKNNFSGSEEKGLIER